jgi:hypothetical protein
VLAPCVCAKFDRSTCIVVRALRETIWYISVKSKDLVQTTLREFNFEWSATQYPVGRAATSMLKSPGMSQAAKEQLKKLAVDDVPAVPLFKPVATNLANDGNPITWAQLKEMKMSKKEKVEGEAVVKEPKAPKEKKPKIGDLIIEMLLAGAVTETILLEVASQFPESRTKAANVAWYKSKLYAEGKLQKKPKAEPKAKKVKAEAEAVAA